MTSPSNLYAEKIFAEHPLALWALDDKVDFISLIDSNDKSMSGWTINNGQFLSNVSILSPISESPTIGVSTTNANKLSLTSQTVTDRLLLDQDKNSFNISTYFKSAVDAVVEVGYILDNNPPVVESFNYLASAQEGWAFLSKTFDIPVQGTSIKLYISVKQSVSITSEFYFNNLSFGQWSEISNTASSGVVPQLLSSYKSINLADQMAIPAQSYGLSNIDGYYLASSKKLFAENSGFPIVYGAANLTKIYPNPDGPSVIIPGLGFLGDSGRYMDMTAEMWIRITPETSEARRVFGPIASLDGLYVQGEFLVIKVGNSVGSYFVSEWGRPMLLHFRVSTNTASLLIDGEQVISITTDTASLSLPQTFVGDLSQDWLGFYSYSDIQSYEIDCVAIYSYQIPEIVAKRRFVYGQGVEFPELSNASLIGASTFIDYRVANYANNYIYPDMGRWNQGILDNAIIENNVLQSPKYSLPDVVFNNKSISKDEWLSACSASIDNNELFASVDLSLADSPAKTGGYLLFQKLNILTSDVKGIYGIFKTTSSNNQILFKIENKLDGSTFTISTDQTRIKYELAASTGATTTAYSAAKLAVGSMFAAGIDIEKLAQTFGGAILKFFGAAGKLSVYVGGQQSFENTFQGKIYKVAFSTQRNLNKISYLVSDNGTLAVFEGDDYFINAGLASTTAWDETYIAGLPETANWTSVVSAGAVNSQAIFDIMDHIASYTLNPRVYVNSFILDISAESYWQDYIPLSYLSKIIPAADGTTEDRLDFIQFNISNPKVSKYLGNYFDTSDAQVRTYVTFQYMSVGPNNDHDNYIYTQKLPKSGIVKPVGNWLLTKYEVNDDSIIYVPKDADFKKLAIVLHLEIESKAIISNPIKIKSIQVASQALSSIRPTEIKTRFGESLAAYTLRGIYPDYRAENPVSIYKSSTPYLYLTNNSGIQMRGILESTKRRGIRSKINPQRSNLYRVGAMQILARYPEELFPAIPHKLITISSKDKTVSLYVEAANAELTRGRVYILNDKTALPDDTVSFYLNGVIVKDLYISPNSWNMIGIQFREALNFNSITGYLDITGPLLVNGMTNYRLTSSQDSTTSVLRTWSQVRTMLDKPNSQATIWEDFLASSQYGPITWENILYIPTLKTYLVDPRVAYRLYTGTNKIIVGDNNRLRFNGYSYRVYNDIKWQSSLSIAV